MIDVDWGERYAAADMRTATTALAAILGLALLCGFPGCAEPYSGKPARLKTPRKKKPPETEEAAATAAPVLDEKCNTNFFEPPTDRRNVRVAQSLAREADRLLVAAEDTAGQERIGTVKDALSKLSNSLKADPYGPEATYQMAAAYALVGKKRCALDLLERLQELTKMPDVEGEAERTIQRALRDQRFELFRKDANAALGR